jgi:hypothetical protein
VLVALVGFAGCGGGSGRATVPLTEVASRYQAIMDPANAALAAFVTQALAYGGGAPTGVKAAAHSTEAGLNDASHRVGAIAAPAPIGRDIRDVANALTTVAHDLASLAKATGAEIQPGIAKAVADAGRESAADAVVNEAIKLATTPTTEPPPTVVPPVTTTVPVTTTIVARHTTTTRPRTTTTFPRVTTTRPRVTTTTVLPA